MKVNIIVDDGCYMPQKAHREDAGFDIRTPRDFPIYPKSSEIVDTGIHIEIPSGYVGFIKSKSGLNVKRDLVCEGVIDAGYTGSIVVKMYNNGHLPYYFKKGDKLTQIVLLPIPEVELCEVSEFTETERGNNGFGSSGR